VHEDDLDVTVRLPDGRERVHERLAPGNSLWDDIDRYTLEHTAQGYRLTFWHGQCWHFKRIPGARTTHVLVCITDRCNNAIHLRYAKGELSEATDSMGRELRFISEGGRLRSIRLRQKNREPRWLELVRYEYDGKRRLAAVFDPKNQPLRYEYTGGVLTKETNRNGLSFYFEYDWDDPDGWCVRTWGDGGIYDRVITYDKHRHFTVVEDSRDGKTLYYGNAAGLVDGEVDPTGREKRYEWDQTYRKTAEIDGAGNRTEWHYDKHGNTTLVQDALKRETSWTYNELNLPVRMINPAGGEWSMTYDARGILVRAVNPLGHEYRLTHDSHGQLVALTDPDGNTTRIRYGAAGEFVKVTDAEDAVTRSDLDAMGRVIRQTNALGGITKVNWDECSRPVGIRWPDGSIESCSYDPAGNLVEHTRRDGTTVRYRYCGLNQLAVQIDPTGREIEFRRDTEENLIAIVNEAGEEYVLEYDLAGRIVKEQGFDGRKTETLFDRTGRACELVNAQKKRTKIERDAAGRIVKVIVPRKPMPKNPIPPGEVNTYEYNALDGIVRAANSAGEVTFKRDLLSRVIEEQFNGVTIAVRYGKNGARLERSTSLGHRTLYANDARGDLLALTFGIDPRWMDFSPESLRAGGPPVRAPWKATWKRDAAGNETERALPGGVVSRWEHDQAGRPQLHRLFSGDAMLAGTEYQWKPGDQIASLIDTQKGETKFSHDERGYLIAATRPDGSVEYRVPDEVGNLHRTWERKDRTYGPGGLLKNADGVEYRHDPDGRLIEKVTPNGEHWKYTWDYADQLVEVLRPDGRNVAFTYDPLGRRTSKTMDGRTTRYVWDGEILVHEVSEGEPLVTWEFEPETFAPVAKIEGDTKHSVLTDHLGTPAALVDDAGRLAWKGQLDLYGVAHAEVEKTACPWHWPGQYRDEETGLYYNRFRYYDPKIGNYISQDPIGLQGGLTLYAYVHDPLTWLDPLGLARALWSLTDEMSDAKVTVGKRTYFRHKTTLLWWSRDTARHAGSAFKVFEENADGTLKWYRDADEYGGFIDPEKKNRGLKGRKVCK
jgi:RHS repeat-associated protein